VQLAVGLPPAHYGRLYARFEAYFVKGHAENFTFRGKPYAFRITEAVAYPQAYAAAMTVYAQIREYSKVIVFDLGGWTADYMQMKYGKHDLSVCDSLENGVIHLYNQIKSKVSADFDLLLDESDVDAILRDKPADYGGDVRRVVDETAQNFVDDLFAALRERMIDLRTGRTVFVGGGAILLKKQILASGKVSNPVFIEEISANVRGYALLYNASKLKR
jgi:plasmid segregation protein ParM